MTERYGKTADFRILEDAPFNGGTPLNLPQMYADVIAQEHFFVRSHGEVPQIDPAAYWLKVEGMVARPMSLSLDDLRHLPRREMVAVLQCAGNRRVELNEYQSIGKELMWNTDGIGIARWSGFALRDVLSMAGAVDRPDLHVAFEGLDRCEKDGIDFNYGGSIPLPKALSPEVLLADSMNGQPLTPVHGAPLRVVVGGYIGARSIKWLGKIIIQETPSDNYYQSVAYQTPEGIMLGEYPVNAIVQSPVTGSVMYTGGAPVSVPINGVAMVGGGRAITRVEWRVDDGAWQSAALDAADDQPFGWRRWSAEVVLSVGEHVLQVRAVDSAGNHQPARIEDVWTPRGYLNNAWHTIRVTVSTK